MKDKVRALTKQRIHDWFEGRTQRRRAVYSEAYESSHSGFGLQNTMEAQLGRASHSGSSVQNTREAQLGRASHIGPSAQNTMEAQLGKL
jgi:hypothetical protein